jgi:5,10-methylenetetrahydromethanopterin reductase
MSRPRIELGLYPTRAPGESVRLGVLAETLGLDTVWVIDSPVLWRELWVTMTAIGAATSRIRVGSAVTTGVTRHPSVTASAAASLAELTSGRFRLGLGSGDSSLVTTGARPQRVAEFRETVQTLRLLLTGEAAPIGAAKIQIAWASSSRVPVYVAASGPKMLELAGALADGVIMMVGVSEPIVRAAIDRVHAGARAGGRRCEDVDLVLWTACAVSDRSPAEAVEAVKANVARAVIRALPHPLPPPHQDVVARIRQAYDYAFHSTPLAPHGTLVPDALVADFAVAGTSAACATALRRVAALGVNAIALALPDAPFEDRGTMLARIASEVLPAM